MCSSDLALLAVHQDDADPVLRLSGDGEEEAHQQSGKCARQCLHAAELYLAHIPEGDRPGISARLLRPALLLPCPLPRTIRHLGAELHTDMTRQQPLPGRRP